MGALSLELTSEMFNNNQPMPSAYTCEGDNISPPLQWSHPPHDTQSLVLICDDPDAPDPANPKMTWVHWVMYDIPVSSNSLSENISADETLDNGAHQGKTDFHKIGYGGPCPPIGSHRYFFKLYALDINLNLPAGKTKQEIETAMEGHILDQGELIGTYQKS